MYPPFPVSCPSRGDRSRAVPSPQLGRSEARTGLRMMPVSPRSPRSFRTAAFRRSGWKAGLSDGACSARGQVKPAPGIPWLERLICFRPSCAANENRDSRSESGPITRKHTAVESGRYSPPQGPSLESGLCCPGPSSLNRPHPPHSQAHRDFAEHRLIRSVIAVRERLGCPRVVPSFRCPFLPDMPPSLTPGSSRVGYVQ